MRAAQLGSDTSRTPHEEPDAMKISHRQPPAPQRVRPLQLALLASAVVVAVSLLSFYVQLVGQSVERGAHLRYEQQSSANTGAKPVFASFSGDALPKSARRHAARGELSAVASSETAVRE
jgi:hypothetical protein